MRAWHVAVGLGGALVLGVGLWLALRPAQGVGGAGAAAAAAPASSSSPREPSTAEKAGEFFAGALTALVR